MTVDRVNSDHHPVKALLEGEVKDKRNRGKYRKCWREVWDDEDRNVFRQKVGRLEMKRKG